jgi:hypothetical protein
MNNNQASLSQANSSLKETIYVSCHQRLSKQCILRAQLGFKNLPLTFNRALITNSNNILPD